MQKYCETVEEKISPNISCKSPGTLTPWQVGFHFSTRGLLLRKVEPIRTGLKLMGQTVDFSFKLSRNPHPATKNTC